MTGLMKFGGISAIALIPLLLLIINVVPVLAQHDAIITITPSTANCNHLGNTFTVNIKNNLTSSDSIFEVRIYSGTAGIVDFDCGPIPNPNWRLYNLVEEEGYCEYKTNWDGPYAIGPGEDLDFTFDAVMSSGACSSQFLISTLDNKRPEGEHEYNWPEVKIDCTDPEIEKTVGDPKIAGDGFDWWITQDTNIHVTATDSTDDNECNLGLDYCRYTYQVDGSDDPDFEEECELDFGGEYEDGWCIFENGETINFDFLFNEDSVHDIEIECYDVVGNKKVITETDKVDDTEPETNKTFIGPQKIDGLVEWIDGVTTIELTPEDGGETCAVGVDKTWYRNDWWVEGEGAAGCYDPAKYCNFEWYGFFDSPYETPEPGCIDECQGLCEKWESLEYGSWEDCVMDCAYGPCEVDPSWKLYDGTPIQKDNESCHVLRYFSVDHLGNIEDMKINCFFVDKTAPKVIKDNGEAIPDTADVIGPFHWITTKMPITFTCDDSWNEEASHPSGDEELCFKVSYDLEPYDLTEEYCIEDDGRYMNDEGYCCISATMENPFEFYFKEESVHDLEYYCEDAVEKKSEPEIQWYKVDDTVPTITKTMIGEDHLGDCPPDYSPDGTTHICYVRDDGSNGVRVDVQDGGEICAVDQTECEYRLLWGEGMTEEECNNAGYEYYGEWEGKTYCLVAGGDFGEEGKDIIFYEDSKHILIISCEDALKNRVVDAETFLVDSTPPVTTKVYGEPYKADPMCVAMCEGIEECIHAMCAQWITGGTPITLTAEDEKVGVEKIYWGDSIVPDEACWAPGEMCHPVEIGMTEVLDDEVTFYKGNEESCHVIQYYAVDSLGNEEPMKWQCVFVDNTPPEGIKTVGDPKILCGEGEEPTGVFGTTSLPERGYNEYDGGGIGVLGVGDGPA